jgi:hypothetical protein
MFAVAADGPTVRLRRPDLGGVVRDKSPDTVQDYRKRYDGWARRLSRLRQEPVGIIDLIDDLCKRAASLRPNSYFVYKAVLIQELEDAVEQGDLTIERAQSLVDRIQPEEGVTIGSKAPLNRTSAGRDKHIRPEGISAIRTAASARGTATYINLGGVFEYGIRAGTRPCELFGARLEGRTLIIKAAKFSEENERGISKEREIELLDFDEFELDDIGQLLARLNAELVAAKGNRTLLVRRYGAAWRELRKEMPWASKITLRTTRAQFRATMKRTGLSTSELAAALGHASAETGASNYGAANKGWRPVPGEKPIAVPEMATKAVRVGARTKTKLARGQPISLTELRLEYRRRGPQG